MITALNNITPALLRAFDIANYSVILNDTIGLTKNGNIDLFFNGIIIPIHVKPFATVQKIESGIDFILALTDHKELFYIHITQARFTVFFICDDVERIWARGSQFYFESSEEFCGALALTVPMVRTNSSENAVFNRIWNQSTNSYRQSNKRIEVLSAQVTLQQ
jgi:hypothetical protein